MCSDCTATLTFTKSNPAIETARQAARLTKPASWKMIQHICSCTFWDCHQLNKGTAAVARYSDRENQEQPALTFISQESQAV